MRPNPLLDDRHVAFLLNDVFDAQALIELPYFSDHSAETFDLFLDACRKLAREVLFPAYKVMDEQAAYFEAGRIVTHPRMREIYPRLVELGILNATRPYDVGGQQLPLSVFVLAAGYLSAANVSALGFASLTTGAAHLIEAFGDQALKDTYMARMYAGQWTGTMALTEPQAGSSLADVATRARHAAEGHYLIDGSKIFISGGDQDFTENIVHLVLARIEGAPAGTKGISLFVVPKRRWQAGRLVDNDVATAGTFHKLGFRGIPSVALSFGEQGDCHGYLVGQPHQGLKHMFQMMNEARIGVGSGAASTASVAYLEALEYARTRPQGRKLGAPPTTPPVPIIEHPDVRRMLLRQKAIVEGSLSLIVTASRYADLAAHSQDEPVRRRSQALLDLLTPIVKTFPSEKGFEANALAIQVHGGYGYTGEFLVEAWLRDQKLNSLHEGTTGIQSLDLLGRKVMGSGGAALVLLEEEITECLQRAGRAELPAAWIESMRSGLQDIERASLHLGQLAAREPSVILQHSVDYLDMLSTLVIGWQWLEQAAAAQRALHQAPADPAFYRGKLAAAGYWVANELPRVGLLAAQCESSNGESSDDPLASLQTDWL